MKKYMWWILIFIPIVLVLARFWSAYQNQQAIEDVKQHSISTFTLKSDMYQDNYPTGDTFYLRITGVGADELGNGLIETMNYTHDGLEVRTIRADNISITEPMMCSFTVEGANYQVYSNNHEWGEVGCELETMLKQPQ